MDQEKIHSIEIPLGEKTLKLETGKIARQAGGSILLSCGETVILSTACAASVASAEIDFLPLRVDYQEKYSSAGRTAGGFLKREGRPTEREILVSRLIDRPIRPMFEEGFYQETQLLAYVYSYDGVNIPDVLAITAASAALTLSDIPLIKPLGAVRVGRVKGAFLINPSLEEMKESDLDLVIAGTEDAVLMIEGYAKFLTEEEVLQAISTGHVAIQKICHALEAWRQKIGRPKKRDLLRKIPENLKHIIRDSAKELLASALQIADKQERETVLSEIKLELFDKLFTQDTPSEHNRADAAIAFKELQSELMRQNVLQTKKRVDGRALDEIRPIHIEQGLFPRTHGSSLFTRGETQTLAICTLGGENSAQRFEDLNGEGAQRFYLQYFFPPFSVGEVGRMGAPGRREIGHGKLAERALLSILPKEESFPYVIRLESNITESNGSSSMASVCGGCLAMMDAGVPIQRPVSGIAMGLILEGSEFVVLSDILGIEDALGDMDFKVTGDEQGITAFQMDIKVEGITLEIMEEALLQAKKGRDHILKKMLAKCPQSRSELSSYAPRIETIQIKQSKIGTVIGPGGKQIRAIMEETGVEIDISDSGLISLSCHNEQGMARAKEIIITLTSEVEIGKIYRGRITSVKDFGYFVEIFGKEGLCHISEISPKRLQSIHDAPFKEGDWIEVKVLDVSDQGKIRLSHRALLKEEATTK